MEEKIPSFYPGIFIKKSEDKKIIQYPWDEFTEATEESGKSLAELFDFKTGTLIWRKGQEDG